VANLAFARSPSTTPDLPEDVLALLDQYLDLCGTYGDPEGWRPVQYAELVIEHDQGEVEIVVYNRAILLFMTGRPVRPGVVEALARLGFRM